MNPTIHGELAGPRCIDCEEEAVTTCSECGADLCDDHAYCVTDDVSRACVKCRDCDKEVNP